MNILQINVRASQGGAGRVALDLHRRLRNSGVESHFLYGYASGIVDDSLVAGDASVLRIGTKASVLTNYACHNLFGFDAVTAHRDILNGAIAEADVVHLHAPHHYFVRWGTLVDLLRRHNKPVVATAHDWWFITGRCGFVENCSGWKRGCGECGKMRFRDLPSIPDFSRYHRRKKIESIRALGGAMYFVCPSRHLAADYRLAYPEMNIQVIPNSTDMEFEQALCAAPEAGPPRDEFLFSASDLSSPGKVDGELVRALIKRGSVAIALVGRNNPFGTDGVRAYGEIRGRTEMVARLQRAKALVFCSRMDNAPLTIIEALSAGCYVLAYDSPAAQEMLEQVGGRCLPDRQAMIAMITGGHPASLYGGVSNLELGERARAVFSGTAVMQSYLALYRQCAAS